MPIYNGLFEARYELHRIIIRDREAGHKTEKIGDVWLPVKKDTTVHIPPHGYQYHTPARLNFRTDFRKVETTPHIWDRE
jgi:hypothetical protein